ncbi:hypothetical protein FOG51_01683 [Hanseniaspora uvarum]|nr:hypothetical protein FOG51_01683 [Hanseniaspora uvarum]
MPLKNKIADSEYVIVLDAGSSGTRSFLYRIDRNGDENLPKIYTTNSLSFKHKPGISSYYNFKTKKVDVDDLFEESIEKLLEKTYKQLKVDLKNEVEDVDLYLKDLDIPIFVQATAGMRLLPEKAQNEILDGICSELYKKNSKWPFKVYENQCLNNQVDIIDGQLEGVYGWLSLNYQLENLSGSNNGDKDTYGFMDMGGASQQIAFAPSIMKINSNKKSTSLVRLNDNHEYDLFVKTWLGFGTNQARKRYLQQLIMLNLENNNDFDDDDFTNRDIYDNCLPKNAVHSFTFNHKEFNIKGLGEFEKCEKMIYPLLLKHIPCDDDGDAEGECLFNGVTVPKINFEHDKFVGISEYYYLTKDLFDMHNKPINFITLQENIKDFCETDYSVLRSRYPNLDEDLLVNSCFKLNWLTNVLHEGFQFPRLGLDDINSENDHIPFMTMGEVNDMELSWTMGKAIMYAASLDDKSAGFYPQTGDSVTSYIDFSKSGKMNLNHGVASSSGVGVFGFVWLIIFTIPFLIFKILFFCTVIQLIHNNLKRTNLFNYNNLKINSFYNSHKHKNVFLKMVSTISAFLNNTVINGFGVFVGNKYRSHFNKEFMYAYIFEPVPTSNDSMYSDLELGKNLGTKHSSQIGTYSGEHFTDNPRRATTSYQSLRPKADRGLRTAFSLSDFKNYE